MPKRLIFRMTYIDNLEIYFRDQEIQAKNVRPIQPAHQISYAEINERRGDTYRTPNGEPINDYVPFYFSPSTAMAYSIHKENVSLIDPAGNNLGAANMDDIAFIICDPQKISDDNLDYWYTNIACNSGVPPIYKDDIIELESHINWSLFDDTPKMAIVTEIGYEGVCKYCSDSELKPEWHNRKQQRMAEFLIKDKFPMELAECIILKHDTKKLAVQEWIANASLDIPVFIKRDCYF